MNLHLQGFKQNCGDTLMGGIITHKGRALTEAETRVLVNYGIEKGYETIRDFPDEVADEICDTHGNADWMQKYDDTPEFISLPKLQRILEKMCNCYGYDFDPQELFLNIQEEI